MADRYTIVYNGLIENSEVLRGDEVVFTASPSECVHYLEELFLKAGPIDEKRLHRMNEIADLFEVQCLALLKSLSDGLVSEGTAPQEVAQQFLVSSLIEAFHEAGVYADEH